MTSIFSFQLPSNSKVLVVGAGGGFDFLCGLPIVFDLEAQGHETYIANYSFTDLQKVSIAKLSTRNLLEVTPDSYLEGDDYFPELYLSQWFSEKRGMGKPVWCLSKLGVLPRLESYNHIIERFNIDAVVCVQICLAIYQSFAVNPQSSTR